MKYPFKYLGMPVGGCHKKEAFWDGVVEKIKERLGRWKGRIISMAGRICLIKSVLSAIPLFYMSLFKILVIVMKKIVKIQRNFLWGWRSGGRKIVWVSWEKVCEPRLCGFLGRLQVWGLEKFERAKIKQDWVPLVVGAKGDLVDEGVGGKV